MYSKNDMEVQTQIVEVKLGDEKYPSALREISDPPKQLFCRGDISLLQSYMTAIIGTRKPTGYGVLVAKQIGAVIAKDQVVVSGLAYGIDAIAHETALKHGGKTVAVLGSGVDDASVYPRVHRGLANRIVKAGGLLISEYMPGSKPLKFHFPARNRIIAGLSQQVLVVEAGVDSGTLITANLALDYNREVWAVPGSINSEMSKGTNQLILEGAKPLVDVGQIQAAPGLEKKEGLEV